MKAAWLLRALALRSIITAFTLGTAIGITNVLVNHVHWLGAYLIACPSHA